MSHPENKTLESFQCSFFQERTHNDSCHKLFDDDDYGWYQYCFKASATKINQLLEKSLNITSTTIDEDLPQINNIHINCDQWHRRLRDCIILWDILICIIIHIVAILVSVAALIRHRIGRTYPLLLVFNTIVHPITKAFVTAVIIREIAKQIQPGKIDMTNEYNSYYERKFPQEDFPLGERPKKDEKCQISDYSFHTQWAPVYSLFIALVLNILMLISNFFTRRNMRFI